MKSVLEAESFWIISEFMKTTLLREKLLILIFYA